MLRHPDSTLITRQARGLNSVQPGLTESAVVTKVCENPGTGLSESLRRQTGPMTCLDGCTRRREWPAGSGCLGRDLMEETYLMPTLNRRAAGRRRAWGRGPIILKFDSLERRELLTGAPPAAELAGSSLVTTHAADWNDTIGVQGTIVNQGGTGGDGSVRRRSLCLAVGSDRAVRGPGGRCRYPPASSRASRCRSPRR